MDLYSRALLQHLPASSFSSSAVGMGSSALEDSLLDAVNARFVADGLFPPHWIQADLLDLFYVTHVSTQGHGTEQWWVTTYTLQIGLTEDHLPFVNDPMMAGAAKVFTANTDNNSTVTNTLDLPVRVWLIRLNMVTVNTQPALRWNIEGREGRNN